MNVYTNNMFEGHWPVPTAAVVVADTPHAAAELLNDALESEGLPRTARVCDMVQLVIAPGVRILATGEY